MRDGLRGRQAKARSVGLSAVERLEQVRQLVWTDRSSAVPDLEERGGWRREHTHPDAPLRPDGAEGVAQEVDEDLLDLRGVERLFTKGELLFDGDAARCGVCAQHLDGLRDEQVETNPGSLGRLRSGQLEVVVDEVGEPIGLANDDAAQPLLRRSLGRVGKEHLRRAPHRRERVSNLVSQRRRDLPELGESVEPRHLVFFAANVRQVLEDDEHRLSVEAARRHAENPISVLGGREEFPAPSHRDGQDTGKHRLDRRKRSLDQTEDGETRGVHVPDSAWQHLDHREPRRNRRHDAISEFLGPGKVLFTLDQPTPRANELLGDVAAEAGHQKLGEHLRHTLDQRPRSALIHDGAPHRDPQRRRRRHDRTTERATQPEHDRPADDGQQVGEPERGIAPVSQQDDRGRESDCSEHLRPREPGFCRPAPQEERRHQGEEVVHRDDPEPGDVSRRDALERPSGAHLHARHDQDQRGGDGPEEDQRSQATAEIISADSTVAGSGLGGAT